MSLFRAIGSALGLANERAPMVLPADDPAMQEAARLARETFPRFVERLREPQAGDENFLVKIPLELERNSLETIWASDPQQEADGRWTAVLENLPMAAGYRTGQRVAFDPASIHDWAYYSADGLEGGFSQRVMIERLPEPQQAEMRARLGIRD